MKRILNAVLLAVTMVGADIALADKGPDQSVQQGETFTDDKGHVHGLGYQNKDHHKTGVLYWLPRILNQAPPSYDARTVGQISAVKNQESCGSCWAFAITKAFESALKRSGKPELDLSEQQVVSCDRNASGCGGGNMDDADYVIHNGLALESDYPYTASSGRCKNPLPPIAAHAVRWGYIGTSNRGPTLDEIKAAFAQYGVLYTTVAAGGSDWGGSRIHMSGCGNGGSNHMVGLAGYNASDELIIANSWGSDWGEGGYAYAKQGCDNLASGSESVGFIEVDNGPGPGPIVPHVRLPAQVSILAGTELMLGVRSEPGVTYSWSAAGVALPESESVIYVSPAADTVYTLKGHTSTGDAESSVQVYVTQGLDFN